MKTNLKPGDVVIIEWKKIQPHYKTMKRYNGCLGVIESIACVNYWVTVDFIGSEHPYSLIWNPTSLTKIGEL